VLPALSTTSAEPPSEPPVDDGAGDESALLGAGSGVEPALDSPDVAGSDAGGGSLAGGGFVAGGFSDTGGGSLAGSGSLAGGGSLAGLDEG
jgi:hypothetical protein